MADGDYGVDEFDFWLPRRRPHQIMPALRLDAPLRCYPPENLLNGRLRPEQQTNARHPPRTIRNPPSNGAGRSRKRSTP